MLLKKIYLFVAQENHTWKETKVTKNNDFFFDFLVCFSHNKHRQVVNTAVFELASPFSAANSRLKYFDCYTFQIIFH